MFIFFKKSLFRFLLFFSYLIICSMFKMISHIKKDSHSIRLSISLIRVDINRGIHVELLHHLIQRSRVPPLATLWMTTGRRPLMIPEDGQKNTLGNGSHANWRRAARPVNLCSELLHPGVWLGNDISSFTSLLHLYNRLCWSWHITEEYYGGRCCPVCSHAKI